MTSGRRSVGRVVAAPLIAVVRVYQRFISPLTPPSCRYYPSCSSYAVTALERYGPVRGLAMAARRLLRCHPWTDGGVDHVPDRDPVSGRPVPGTTGPKPYPPTGTDPSVSAVEDVETLGAADVPRASHP